MSTRMVATLVASVGMAACGGSSSSGYLTSTNPAPVAPNTIVAGADITFNPTTLTVTKGTSVAFVHQAVVHQVYFVGAGKPADLPRASNSTISRTFDNAGSYGVRCSIHSDMAATITVQ
ncbi:MAG TPA: plastocyanin/azurin family copper-binding protein [Gemmatimonadaceae bacterium]|nr:plastocyanin/azurin family copper-binding protein [Gemmatimonadaceae bacterium]